MELEASSPVRGTPAPVPMGFVALQDTYAESGEPEELFEKYGLTAGHIAQEAKRLLENGTTP